jgi:Cu2+-exporting ATPase
MDDNDRSPDGEEASDGHSHHGHRDSGSEEQTDSEENPRVEQSMLEAEPEDADDAEHEVENQFEHGMDHGDGGHERGDHGGMHAGHEQLFRRRFFVSTLLSIPLLLYSETLHIYTLWIRSDSSSSPQTPRSSAIASDGFTAG